MPMRSWNPVIKIFAYYFTISQINADKFSEATQTFRKDDSPLSYRANFPPHFLVKKFMYSKIFLTKEKLI
jgi:hypothetical protein